MIAKKRTATSILLVLAVTLTLPPRLGLAAPMLKEQPSPDFSLSFFHNPQTVKRGSGTIFQVEIQPLNGFSGTVHIEISESLPPRIICNCSPFDVSVADTGITFASFTVDVPKPVATAPTGTFQIDVLATSGSISHSETASRDWDHANPNRVLIDRAIRGGACCSVHRKESGAAEGAHVRSSSERPSGQCETRECS